MKKMIIILIRLSFASPVRAGLVTDFDPVEKNLIEKKQLEEDLNREFTKQPVEPFKPEPRMEEPKSGSNWWKWTLGVLVVGGAAAAASGGKSGGGSSSGGGGTTTVNTSW